PGHGAASRAGSAGGYVGIELGGRHVLVAEQLLHRADVVAGFEKMRGEGVAQRVAGRRLDDAGPVAGELDCALQGRLVDVMSAPAASARVRRLASGREDVLPPQVTAGVRVLASQGMRQMHLTKATGQISLVDHLHPAYLEP